MAAESSMQEKRTAYTVKQVSRLSGVSVRTLHFYDEVGLLKPAYQAANGYRFYEEPQLLTLQQILFYLLERKGHPRCLKSHLFKSRYYAAPPFEKLVKMFFGGVAF